MQAKSITINSIGNMISSICWRLYRNGYNKVEIEDLKQMAYFGFEKAKRNYKESEEVKFTTFAYKVIESTIKREYRKIADIIYKPDYCFDLFDSIERLDLPINYDSDDLRIDFVSASPVDFNQYVIENSISKELAMRMNELDSTEKVVLESYFIDGLSFNQIAEVLNKTSVRIRQIYKKALRNLAISRKDDILIA